MRNHQRFFDKQYLTLDYPICQNTTVGFVRSPLDRHKLVDFMSRLVNESIKFGQAPLIYESKEAVKKRVVENLREIAFASS